MLGIVYFTHLLCGLSVLTVELRCEVEMCTIFDWSLIHEDVYSLWSVLNPKGYDQISATDVISASAIIQHLDYFDTPSSWKSIDLSMG